MKLGVLLVILIVGTLIMAIQSSPLKETGRALRVPGKVKISDEPFLYAPPPSYYREQMGLRQDGPGFSQAAPAGRQAPSAQASVQTTSGGGQVVVPQGGTAQTIASNQSPYAPPQGFTAEQLSPYYKTLRIGGVSPSRQMNARGSAALSSSYPTAISVTGWRLKGNRGDFIVPGAIADYAPGRASYPIQDIVLESGDTVFIYDNASPIGANLRPNKCTGYLNNSLKFDPPLPASCPYRDDRSVTRFTGWCQDLIRSFNGTCRDSNSNLLNSPQDPQCVDYIKEHYNYGACYREFRFTPNFFSRNWYVWLGAQINFDVLHDRILLYDNNNLVVDEYVY